MAFLLYQCPAYCQQSFNKRIDFNYPAQLFTSVETDSSGIYCLGVFGDSTQYFQDGCLIAKFNNTGELLWHHAYTSIQRPLSTYHPNLKWSSNNNLRATGYYVKSDTVGGIILDFDAHGSLENIQFQNKLNNSNQ